MTEQEIQNRVRQLTFDALSADSIESITPETNFSGDLGADSLDLIGLVISVEKEFNISIPDEVVDTITTVSDLVNYVNKKVNAV